MQLFGFILVVVGGIVFISTRIIMNQNEKRWFKLGQLSEDQSEEEFLELMHKGLNLVKWAGVILIIIGGIMLLAEAGR